MFSLTILNSLINYQAQCVPHNFITVIRRKVFYQGLEISVYHSHLFNKALPTFGATVVHFLLPWQGARSQPRFLCSLPCWCMWGLTLTLLVQIWEKSRFGKEWKKGEALSKAAVQFVPCAILLCQAVDIQGDFPAWFIPGSDILCKTIPSAWAGARCS